MKGRLKILALIGLKIAIALAFLIYLAREINWKEVSHQLKMTSWVSLLLMLFGSFVGLCLEAFRWKKQVADPQFRLIHAIRAVGMGLTVSVFLPGGSGAIASRVLQLPESKSEERWKLVSQATFWQWSAIWHLGLFCYAIRQIFLGESPIFWFSLGFVSLILASFLLGSKRYASSKWLSYIVFPPGGFSLLYLAAIRYAMYGFVLWLAIQFTPSFLHLSLFKFLPLILLSFSLQFILPVLPLLEIGFRSSVMIWVFTPFLDHESQLVAWAFLLWFFNLIIPAILGLIFGWLWFWKS
jgi:uncharacterized membrane protein YbhN (UPF0104 family)